MLADLRQSQSQLREGPRIRHYLQICCMRFQSFQSPMSKEKISFCLSEGLQKRQQHTFVIERTASASLLRHPYEYFIHDERAFSACRSTPRSCTASVLIEVQPASSATKLRRISIARHGAIVCTACHKSRRLDTFPFAVAATVAPAQNQPSASFFNKGILIFQIVRDW